MQWSQKLDLSTIQEQLEMAQESAERGLAQSRTMKQSGSEFRYAQAYGCLKATLEHVQNKLDRIQLRMNRFRSEIQDVEDFETA